MKIQELSIVLWTAGLLGLSWMSIHEKIGVKNIDPEDFLKESLSKILIRLLSRLIPLCLFMLGILGVLLGFGHILWLFVILITK